MHRRWFLVGAAALLLCGCSSLMRSDAYASAVPRVGYAVADQVAFSVGDSTPATTLGREAATMLIRRSHDGFYDNPAVLINYLYAVQEEVALYRERGDGLETQFAAGQDALPDIKSYLESAFAHTQQAPQFSRLPGDDPWGRVRLEPEAEFKKLLPSEMIALSMYTGEITGKCTTLAALVGALILQSAGPAITPDDIVMLRTAAHTLGFVKAPDGRIWEFSNTHFNPFGAAHADYRRAQRYTHFYGYGFYAQGDVVVPEDLLDGEGTLREMFERASGILAVDVDPDPVLIDYCLQRLDVPDPSLYIAVSRELPHTQALARRLKSLDQAVAWMRDHLADGSIFPDASQRVMTSDQVIVFKTGNPIDKAVLLCAILHERGTSATLHTDQGRVTVHTPAGVVDMDTLAIGPM